MKNIQKYLYYVLLFVSPFIMLSNTSELFEFNKLIFIYIIVSLLLCVWIARMVEARRILFVRTPFDLFIGLFFLSQLFSTFFSIDIHTSIFGYYGRFNGGLLSLVAYLLIYYSLVEFVASYPDRKGFLLSLMKTTLIASTLVILWGLPGKVGYDLSCLVFTGKLNNACWTSQFDPAARMFSTLGQPNWLGAYLGITFFVSLYFFLRSSGHKYKYLPHIFGGIVILQLAAVFFTNSRSSVAAVLFAAIFVIGWVFLNRKSLHLPEFKVKLLLLFTSLLALTLVFKTGIGSIDKYLMLSTYIKPPPALQKPVTTVKPTQKGPVDVFKVTDSLDIRKIVWEGAEKLGKEYPLFGTGVETFAYAYYFVRPQAHNVTSEWDYLYNKAHNEYLNYFATTGFFGVGSYLLFITAVVIISFFWVRPLLKKDESDKDLSLLQAALLCSWLTILITNFVGFSTTVTSLYFYLIPALLFSFQVIKKGDQQHVVPTHNRTLSGSAALIGYGIPFLLAVFFVQYFISYWLADTKYALAENMAKANDYQNATLLLNQAMQLRPDHVYEDKLSYDLANLAFIASYQKNAQLAGELMQTSIKYNDKSIQESPQNILYWKTKVKNLYVYYQITLDKRYIEQGIAALQEGVKLSPTDPKLPYFLATYYSVLYDDEKNKERKKQLEEKSLEEINKSISLKNDYFESYYLKAQLYRKYQMLPEARETYQYILDFVAPGNQQVEQELKSITR